MLRVGITGGIGSGKSTVARIFKLLNVPIYNADMRAKWLILNKPSVKESIIDLLGTEAYFHSGEYNTTFVAGKVFEDQNLLIKLNQIVHPAVKIDFEEWCFNKEGHYPYVIKEAAIMKNKLGLDHIIYVYASEDVRLKRILSRDHRTVEEIRRIMEKQFSEKEFRSISDFVIDNDSEMLIPQVLSIHKKLIS